MRAARRQACGLRQQSAKMGSANFSSTHLKGEIMAVVTVGIDLAKNVFAVYGVNESGKPDLVRPEVTRAKLLKLIAHLPPCLIGMEICSGAHHRAREFGQFGHTISLMVPKFVAPYRVSGKRGKNDADDVAATAQPDS
jgi:transposase